MKRMKTNVRLTIAIILLFSAAFAKAQTADEIVSRHIDAIGGKEKLSAVNTIYYERSTEMMGTESLTRTSIVNGKAYRNESEFNGQKIIQVVTDKNGWALNPFTGAAKPTAFTEDAFKSSAEQVYIAGPLFDYAGRGGKIVLEGKEKIGKTDAYKIKYTDRYNIETSYYIDPSTYYIIKETKKGKVMGQEILITTTFSDYQKTASGLVLPGVSDIDMGQMVVKVTNKKVEVNKAIDSSIFEMK